MPLRPRTWRMVTLGFSWEEVSCFVFVLGSHVHLFVGRACGYCEGVFSPQCVKVLFCCNAKDLAGAVFGELGGCFERLKRSFGETAFVFWIWRDCVAVVLRMLRL